MNRIVCGAFAVVSTLPTLLRGADTSNVTNQVTSLPEITITATRIATAEENTPSAVTVITADEIARSQQYFVADILRGEPGIGVATTGQPGAQTGVFLRGADGDGTLVLVDGIPVNNGFNNGFDFSTLPANNIERIEILRGPQSALYGSEALGGVINIVTKTGQGSVPTGAAQVEYGSFNSLLTRGSLAATEGKFSFSADGSFRSTDNDRINSAYQGINLSGHFGYQINDWLRAALLATYLKSSDGSPNDIYTDDPNDQLKNENYLLGLTVAADPVDWSDTKLTVSHSHEHGLFNEPAPNPPYYFDDYSSLTIAERNRVDLQNVFTLNEQNKFLVGGTFQDDSANYQDSYSALDRTIDTYSAYAQYDFTPVQRVTLTAGGRVDTSDAFGTHETYQFGARFTAPRTETIFRANVGTGFLAPSIDDLYYPGYSNPNLKPEESFGWDLGFEQPLFDGKFRFGATFFHNDYDNLIQYSGVTYEPENIGRARTFGLENFAAWTPFTNVTVRAAYTWLDAKDLDTDEDLVRRAQSSGSVDLDWKIIPRLDATAHAVFTGGRTDNNYDNYSAPAVVTLGSYQKVDLGLKFDLTKNFALYGRVENLLDEHYQEAYGFPALGRGFYGGVRASF